ncbi:hypothetical protein NHX12_009732 [Muraenolepis orangiensis]|uniref:Oxysterol-binding protein n=1 Tax=Muraenolepis orangiensis TaxID=630683 RepID=A0A9Q0DI63_9TELE|nr:hypothetical protein NHX12_009732 [Muraenolepis orangiensis]
MSHEDEFYDAVSGAQKYHLVKPDPRRLMMIQVNNSELTVLYPRGLGAVPTGAVPTGAGGCTHGGCTHRGLGAVPTGGWGLYPRGLGAVPTGAGGCTHRGLGAVPTGAGGCTHGGWGLYPQGAGGCTHGGWGLYPLGAVPTGAGGCTHRGLGAVPTGAVPTGAVPTGAVPTGGWGLYPRGLGAVPTGAVPTGGWGLYPRGLGAVLCVYDGSYEGASDGSFKDTTVLDYDSQARNGSVTCENGTNTHRTTLPAPMFSRTSVSIWSILKKCIGLELSKITMPIAFNEPLSFLQRISEYMEHTYLLSRACTLPDSIQRMQAVAAFAVSAVASQWDRTGKPFNPLLGETYELTRADQGYRLVSEQVSHHPPVSAFHAESLNGDFVFHGSIYPKLKFWGKSVEAEPKGAITLELHKFNEAYTWCNPFCCVHNVILGSLWIEQYGTVEILNHSTGDKCVLNFKSCGMFGKELHRVEGYIQDKSKRKHCVLYGKWTECMWSVDPQTFHSHRNTEKKESKKHRQEETERRENDDADDMPESQDTVSVIPGSTLLWRIASRPTHSTSMYNFTSFAMALNEMEPGMEATLPPTDCRLRPDIRAMENGLMDEAGQEKERLEQKQRESRKERAKSLVDWPTRWFQQGTNPYTGSQDWLYTGGYFNRNYADLPSIY